MKTMKMILVGLMIMGTTAQAGVVSWNAELLTYKCDCIETQDGPGGGAQTLGSIQFKVLGEATKGDAHDMCSANYKRSNAWADIISSNCRVVSRCN